MQPGTTIRNKTGARVIIYHNWPQLIAITITTGCTIVCVVCPSGVAVPPAGAIEPKGKGIRQLILFLYFQMFHF